MTSPAELADRVEELARDDFNIDMEIYKVVQPAAFERSLNNLLDSPIGPRLGQADYDGYIRAPAYTASLDAAETLVPENCKRCWAAGWGIDGVAFATIGFERSRYAATPALALCAAALRAIDRP